MSKEQYKYEWQLISIMHDNYGISLDDFTKLVHEQYEAVPYHDITSTHERISAKKLYHVIETDNYNGDYPDEHFAQVIANAFNQIKYGGANRYYMKVEKNRKLYGPFEP